MFCRKCGYKNTEDAKFCKKCGSTLKRTAFNSRNSNKKTFLDEKWLAVIIILLVGLGVAVGYIIFLNGQIAQSTPLVSNNSTAGNNTTTPVENITNPKKVTNTTPSSNSTNVGITAHQANEIIIEAGAPPHLTLHSQLQGGSYYITAHDYNGNLVGTAYVDAQTGYIESNSI